MTIIPAHSKAAAEAALAHPHVSVTARYIGFKDCRLSYGPAGLSIVVDETQYDAESPMYEYLRNYCQSDISQLEEELRREGYEIDP